MVANNYINASKQASTRIQALNIKLPRGHPSLSRQGRASIETQSQRTETPYLTNDNSKVEDEEPEKEISNTKFLDRVSSKWLGGYENIDDGLNHSKRKDLAVGAAETSYWTQAAVISDKDINKIRQSPTRSVKWGAAIRLSKLEESRVPATAPRKTK